MSKSKILFMMTGSIACYKACQVISRLVQAGHDVQVAASPAALQFVGNATFEGLTGKTVVSDLYAAGNVMDHIHLMRWADLVLVAPATANYINKISQGVGDDLLTTLFLAHDFKKPFLIAPAMNTSMYMHPVTQSSLKRLRDMGVEILEAASGVLACGEVGYGKLLDPDMILQEVYERLGSKGSGIAAPNEQRAFSILLTAGGTQEPLDDVRMITNRSSGETGARLAELFADFGCEVFLLRSVSATAADARVSQATFTSFLSLQKLLEEKLEEKAFSAVIHLAAVSDFSVESVEINGQRHPAGQVPKISSEDHLSVHFKNNPKLVDQIKKTRPETQLVAFKLTSHASPREREAAVDRLQAHSRANFIVHNDVAEMDKARGQHSFTLYSKDGKTPVEGVTALASALMQNFLKESL